jgi:spore coat protein U-like protein
MKKLSIIAAAAALTLFSASAFTATTLDSTFAVSVTFTSVCTVGTTAAINFGAYTAFQAGDATGTTTAAFSCSKGLTPSFKFDDATANVQTASALASSGTITAEGVIKGLRYTLSAAVPAVTAGTAAKAGAGGVNGVNSTADTYSMTINGTIPGLQAGDPTGGASQTRTLTISY